MIATIINNVNKILKRFMSFFSCEN
jgi:hypothetical protein